MEMPDSALHMGRISGVFGVNGWVKIFSYTDPKNNILEMTPWLLCQPDSKVCVPVVLKQGRTQGKGLVAQLPDCEDCDAAEQWVGYDIWIERRRMSALASGEYYWADLTGLAVWAKTQHLGCVKGLIETGANDVLVVSGDRERLIPFLQPDVVTNVDLIKGRIEVDWDPDF